MINGKGAPSTGAHEDKELREEEGILEGKDAIKVNRIAHFSKSENNTLTGCT